MYAIMLFNPILHDEGGSISTALWFSIKWLFSEFFSLNWNWVLSCVYFEHLMKIWCEIKTNEYFSNILITFEKTTAEKKLLSEN